MTVNQIKIAKKINPKTKLYSSVIKDQVNEALISHTYNQSNIGLMTGIICASIIWFRLHGLDRDSMVNTWFCVLLGITVLRGILVNAYIYKKRPEKNLRLWHMLFIVGSSAGGLCWGIVPFLFLQHSDASQQILILMIMAGISAGSIPFISSILPAAVAFLTMALLPLVIYFATAHPHGDYLMAFTASTYLMFLIAQAMKINDMLTDGLFLQYELNEAKNLLEHTATHDPLTNVSNRILFSIKFVDALEDAKKHSKLLGLLYLDLNKFKKINDTYGHVVGDKILLIFSQRLKNLFKEDDIVARVGGDEFTVLLKDISQPEDVEHIITRIHSEMEGAIVIDDLTFTLTTSVGSSIYPRDGSDPEVLLSKADDEMYRLKRQSFHS